MPKRNEASESTLEDQWLEDEFPLGARPIRGELVVSIMGT